MTVLPLLYVRDDNNTTPPQNDDDQSAFIKWGRFLIAPGIIVFIAVVIFLINWSRASNGMRPMKGTAWLSPTLFRRFDDKQGVQPIQQIPRTEYPTSTVYNEPPADLTPPAYTEATNPIDMGMGYYSEGGQFVQTAPNLYEAKPVPVEKPKAAAGVYNQQSSSRDPPGKY